MIEKENRIPKSLRDPNKKIYSIDIEGIGEGYSYFRDVKNPIVGLATSIALLILEGKEHKDGTNELIDLQLMIDEILETTLSISKLDFNKLVEKKRKHIRSEIKKIEAEND